MGRPQTPLSKDEPAGFTRGAQSANDLRALRKRLTELGAGHLGLVIKIETRRAFEHLPEILLAAACSCASRRSGRCCGH